MHVGFYPSTTVQGELPHSCPGGRPWASYRKAHLTFRFMWKVFGLEEVTRRVVCRGAGGAVKSSIGENEGKVNGPKSTMCCGTHR